ncbi:RNA-directed DNA polymerase [Capnocytophaga cynodegmi]|uniref:RNA-directed DNA polymerase n=1 Tax=Capnocytophaga cynodegmi TaxID=28189 RepID=UPI003859864F
MKLYYKFYEEIDEDKLFKGLLAFGLFSEKIPNFLSSEKFFEYIKTKKFPYNDKKPTDYIRYSNMRNINILRPLSIPDPFSYANQIEIIRQNWTKIKEHFKTKSNNQNHKVSRIHIRNLYNKESLFEMNYKNFEDDGNPENKLFIKNKYVVNVDISNCFPSIYSHSISWALVGKNIAKQQSSKNFENEYFNQIDFYTRNLKFGETNGILIGPHSSSVISEIILCCIDYELCELGYKFYRNIDDYTCYTNSYAKAEKFIIEITEELKKYELSLNSKKTKITKLPQASVTNWVAQLNHYYFKDEYHTINGKIGLKLSELRNFIDYSVKIMTENDNNSAILNYMIKILSNKYLGSKAKEYYIDKIHHLVLLFPYLVLVLEKYIFQKHNISPEKIKEISEDLYEEGKIRKNYELCSYVIYFSLKYKFQLNQSISSQLKNDSIQSNDCIFLMLSYLYDKKYQNKKYLKEYKDLANNYYKDDFGRYWLFCYEVLTQNELNNIYKDLKKNKVSFILNEFL